MNHAYGSLNKAIQTIWTATAPGATLHFEAPVHPAVLKPNCMLVQWLQPGGPTDQPNLYEALIQLDIYVGVYNRAQALAWASAIDVALGFTQDGGYGRVGRYDWTDPENPVSLTTMRVVPYESGWVNVPDPDPKLAHYARTIILLYPVN